MLCRATQSMQGKNSQSIKCEPDMERRRDALNCPRVFDLRRDGIEVYTSIGFKRPSLFRGRPFLFDPLPLYTR